MQTGYYFILLLWILNLADASVKCKGGGNPTSSPSTLKCRIKIESEDKIPFTTIVGHEYDLNFSYDVITAEDNNTLSQSTFITNNIECTSSEIDVAVSKTQLVQLLSPPKIHVSSFPGYFTVRLKGLLPGRSNLEFHMRSNLMNYTQTQESALCQNVTMYELITIKPQTLLETVYTVIVFVLVTLTAVGLGCTIDMNVVKAHLSRPLAPLIGLFSQFVFMPLIAYTCVQVLDISPGVGLGLFAMGCSPGGSGSNAFCYLLGGDVSLSITMTFISTVTALGFIPIWMFTLGAQIAKDANIKVPFHNILMTLLGIILSCIVGVYIQHRYHLMASRLERSIKYLMAIFLLLVATVGVHLYSYMFYLISTEVLLGSALLPYVGFCLGGLLAFVWRCDRVTVMTIAIETGIQNSGVAFVLLKLSLTGPELYTSIMAPAASFTLTPLPLMLAVVCVHGRRWLKTYVKQKNEAVCDVELAFPR